MKEVDKDRELTKISQSISHNQGHCIETAEMHTTE